MEKRKLQNKNLYFTNDHEWIDFQGSVAYTGICHFKLSGFKEIHQIRFEEPSGFKKKGEVIATIVFQHYEVRAHMPVDGKVIQVNDTLLSGNQNSLLRNAENGGWIDLIVPSQPYERKELIQSKQISSR